MSTEMKIKGHGFYKGKKYAILFMGQTRFGEKAHLAFFDGSKSFWVMANDVSGVTWSVNGREPARSSGRRSGEVKCCHCGKYTPEGDDWCAVCGRAGYEN